MFLYRVGVALGILMGAASDLWSDFYEGLRLGADTKFLNSLDAQDFEDLDGSED